MKKTIIVLFQFFFLQSFLCQKISKKIYVEYQVTKNSLKSKEYLIADSKNALYSTNFIDYNNEKNRIKKDSNNIFSVKQKRIKINAMKYYSSINTTNLYFVSIFPNNKKTIVALDSVPNLQWKIHDNETKKISDLICIKATTTYRGSSITAYFTPEIPIGFGPFKFKGLPGLILEVFNDSKIFEYKWRATKIKTSYKTGLDLKFTNELYNTPVVSYRSIVEEFDEKLKIASKRFASNAPRGFVAVSSKTERNGIEKIYEWEELSKKN